MKFPPHSAGQGPIPRTAPGTVLALTLALGLGLVPLPPAPAAPAASGSAPGIARIWTSSDGKAKFEGELIEYSETEVKIKRKTDFQIFKLPLDRLSAADQKEVRALLHTRAREQGLTKGPYAEKMTGQLVKAVSKQGLNYQIQGNPKWDGKKKYPLLIWLHGAGQSGTDNEAQIAGAPKPLLTPESQEKHPCFFIAPQCPAREIGWKNEPADNVVALIADLIDKLPVDENRIYLTGSSMGGSGTWYLAAKYPQIFAAAVPLCGGNDLKTAPLVKDIPIWVFHGDKDDMVPVERSRTMVKAVQDAGGTLIKYSELAGEGHLITAVVYPKTDLHEWLFAQVKKAAQ